LETGTPANETLRIIGVLGLNRFDELFMTFHPSFHGRGYATEAVTAWLGVLWEEYPTRKSVHGGYFAGNEGSRRVLEKVGFVFDEKWTTEVRGMVEGSEGWEGKVPTVWRFDRPENV